MPSQRCFFSFCFSKNPTHNYCSPLTSPLPLYGDLWITVITVILYGEAILLPAPKGCNLFSPHSNMTFMYGCVSPRSTRAPNLNEWRWSGWWSAGPSSLCWFDNVTSRLCGYSESNQFSTRRWSLAITSRVHAHKNTHTRSQSLALSSSQVSLKRIRRLCQYEPTDGWEAAHIPLEVMKKKKTPPLSSSSLSVSCSIFPPCYSTTRCTKTGASFITHKRQNKQTIAHYITTTIVINYLLILILV